MIQLLLDALITCGLSMLISMTYFLPVSTNLFAISFSSSWVLAIIAVSSVNLTLFKLLILWINERNIWMNILYVLVLKNQGKRSKLKPNWWISKRKFIAWILVPSYPKFTWKSKKNSLKCQVPLVTLKYVNLALIIIPSILNPISVNASLIKYSLYRLNNMGDMQHPCLTPLPILTLSVCLWSWRSFKLCPMYKFRINQLSFLLIPIFLSISSSLIQSTRSKAFF